MELTTLLGLVLVASVAVDGKIFYKCELAQELKRLGVNTELYRWVCMAYAESSFNTAATNTNSGGSSDYGIFQINSYWNCDPQDGRPTYNGCGHPCSDYLNTYLGDDIQCIRQLLREHSGWGFSYGYADKCASVTSSYLSECSL
uniref:lysozyme n=1 Tax=Haliotis discus discus TaxID=91233 RepID=S5G7Z0_HALDI|nr:chicken type lysozyme 2 precursor [Haliotis discus discus]AGQ50333.1 chicken type lysozyme 2 precursor [Haliotis discus discus]